MQASARNAYPEYAKQYVARMQSRRRQASKNDTSELELLAEVVPARVVSVRQAQSADTLKYAQMAFSESKADGSVVVSYYLNNDPVQAILHRVDGPAQTISEADGVRQESWWYLGLPHRENGPAYIETVPDGSYVESWYEHGQRHREHAPAITTFSALSGKHIECWYEHGQRHRELGPASICVHANGAREEKRYVRGEFVSSIASGGVAHGAITLLSGGDRVSH